MIVRKFNFPIPSGMCTIEVPYPMTYDDYRCMMNTLTQMEDGLVPGVYEIFPNNKLPKAVEKKLLEAEATNHSI